MIGAVTYELVAEASGRMEGFAGRLLHAAFFRHLATCSELLSTSIHDEEDIKPFTSSPLLRPQGRARMQAVIEKAPFPVRAGDRFYWRIAALRDDMVAAALSLPPGAHVQVGHVPFAVAAVHADGTLESGMMEREALIASALSAPPIRELSLHFRSPVTFRRGTLDYPVPAPELVFLSLAAKWQATGMPAAIDKAQIEDIARRVGISDWQGRTQRVYFGRRHGASGCIGDFTYSLMALADEERRLLLLLAEFAEFSSVGRLAAQGFGQTRISWK